MIAKIPTPKGIGFLVALVLFITSSCTKVDAGSGIRKENRVEVADFNKISYELGGHLNFTQSNQTQVTVNTTPEVMEALDVFVEDETLYIKRKKGFNIIHQDEITFNITDDDTYGIYTCGSGDVDANYDDNYHFQKHELKTSGSGDIIVDGLRATDQEARVNGSGDIIINSLYSTTSLAKISGSGDIIYENGNVHESQIDISGSGNFQGFDWMAEQADVFCSGSGNGHVRVQQYLNAKISGSGNAFYKGFPILAVSVSGSGDIFDAN